MTEHTSSRHTPKTTHPTLHGLRAQLRRMTSRLRRHYTLANASAMRTATDEWLCDNYYVLEKESKQTVRDIRQSARRGSRRELMAMYRLFADHLQSRMPPSPTRPCSPSCRR